MTPDTWILLIVFDFSVFSQCYITRRPSLLCSTHTLEYWYLKNWPLWYYSFSFVCFLFCCCYFCFVLVGWLVFLFKFCFVFSGVARAEGRWGWGRWSRRWVGLGCMMWNPKRIYKSLKKKENWPLSAFEAAFFCHSTVTLGLSLMSSWISVSLAVSSCDSRDGWLRRGEWRVGHYACWELLLNERNLPPSRSERVHFYKQQEYFIKQMSSDFVVCVS